MSYFSVTYLISSDGEYQHFNIWNCHDKDVALYYPNGVNDVSYNNNEYEVCIKDLDLLRAFNAGYKLIMEKIKEVESENV
jgi:hypothetical protein